MSSETPTPDEVRNCSVASCGRPHHSKGLCKAHYKRRRRLGGIPAANMIASFVVHHLSHTPKGAANGLTSAGNISKSGGAAVVAALAEAVGRG